MKATQEGYERVGKYIEDLLERRQVPIANGCHIWGRSSSPRGYPNFTLLAHRMRYLLYNGELTPGMDVSHVCDQPGCINPEHLDLLPHKGNCRDMVKRGRQWQQRLTYNMARHIILLEKQGWERWAIAKRFKVPIHCINDLLLGRTFKNVPR